MSRARREAGQATVELVLVLPVLAVLVLLLVQVGVVVRADVLLVNAAREAARAAAVDPDPAAAGSAARESTTLDPSRLTVEVRGRGGPGSMVTVELTYRAPTDIALVGPLLPDVTLRASASMRVEGP